MSSQLFCKVLVFVSLQLYADAYYPYPYAQQFDYNYQPSYQSPYQPSYQPSYQAPSYQPVYPQASFPNYGQQLYPYPSNYPIYPNYQPIPQSPSFGQIPQGSYPSVIPQQGGVFPAPFPHMQQSYVPTPYGNIPVEIIDVNPNQGTGVIDSQTSLTPSNETATDVASDETSFTEEKKNVDVVVRKPVSTSSVVQTNPQSTTITRTMDPQSGKINVIVQTSRPPLNKQDNSIEKDEENNEDNETTTKKYYSIFGR